MRNGKVYGTKIACALQEKSLERQYKMLRRQTQWAFMTIFFLIAIACTPIMPAAEGNLANPVGSTVPEPVSPLPGNAAEVEIVGEELTLYIAPELVECVGVAPMECMLVKETADGEYELFYDHIEGFTYIPGYNYELRVQSMERIDPPADASTYVYSLIEVVDQSPADTLATLTIEGTEWALLSLGSRSEVRYDPANVLITASFADGTLSGTAGCNQYSSGYEMTGEMMGTITVGELVATRMLCPENVMDAENAYLAALSTVTDYAIDGTQLLLNYGENTLTFVAAHSAAANGAVGEETVTTAACRFAGTGATLAIDGKRANFTCGSPEQVLLGDIEPGFDGWFIEKATLIRTDGEFTIDESHQAMLLQIELEDGTRCDWAGSGATLAFDEKRVNFSCDADDVVLLGEVTQGDEGWMVEKATLTNDGDGFSIESAEMTMIAALMVE